MIGSGLAWASGYTGAGSRVAIIDTGIDTDHQSMDADAYWYSLQQQAVRFGVTVDLGNTGSVQHKRVQDLCIVGKLGKAILHEKPGKRYVGCR